MPNARTYTIAEASQITGMHRNSIRLKVKTGQLDAFVQPGKFGDEYRIPHSALVRAGMLEDLEDPEAEAATPPSDNGTFAHNVEPEPEHADDALALEPTGALTELFQRHEQAMFRLGFLQAEVERTKALAENAESLQQRAQATQEEVRQLRDQLDTARAQAAEKEQIRRELELAQERLREMEDVKRLMSEMQGETQRLREALEASQQKRPWWKLWES